MDYKYFRMYNGKTVDDITLRILYNSSVNHEILEPCGIYNKYKLDGIIVYSLATIK